jgi:hypothetical protein
VAGVGARTEGAEPLREDLETVAAAASAGLVVGVLVVGVGSPLAMLLLARLNPRATGRLSDDGFVVGHLTSASLGLLVLGSVVGVLGAMLVLAVRDLRVGPAWLRWASVTVGPAVVVGALVVHTDGVDFRVFHPTWLALALFVALPGVAGARAASGWPRSRCWSSWRRRSGWSPRASPPTSAGW